MADLNAHEAGNGGQSQRKPKAQSGLLYSATVNTDADPPKTRGRPKLTEEYERFRSVGSVGVVATTCMYRKAHGTRETPAVEPEDRDQPASRESQAGLSGAAERFVVSMKPSNAGGEKEPYF
jgi:hypothetical protein